jgi:iron(III) transport system permease protein
MTPDGLALIFGLLLYPYVYLPSRAAFSGGMVDVVEASRLLGAGRWRRAVQVAIPLARPAIGGGALLVAMETLNDYGAVKHFGVHTLTAGIFRSWGGLYDTGSALRLSAVLLLIALVLAIGERRLAARAPRTVQGRRYGPSRLTGWRAWAATAWCTVLLGVAFALPVGALLRDAFSHAHTTAWRELGPPVWNTLKLAGSSTLLTLGVALLFAYAQRNGRVPLTRLAAVGYVVPGAVIAIGVMGLAGRLSSSTSWVVIGTLPLVVYAFTVRFLAMATNPVQAGMAQQSRSLDEAARLLGASRLRTFLHVNLPLLRPSILAAAAITLIEVIKELPLTLILRPFGMETLSTHVFYMARIEQWGDAAVPALLIVAVGLVPVFLLERWMART